MGPGSVGRRAVTAGRIRRVASRLTAGCVLLVLGLTIPRAAGAQPIGVTGDWRLSGSVTLSGCLDARVNGTRPATMVAAATQVRARFAANAGIAQGTDRFSLDIIGTVSDGMLTGTFTGVRRGPGTLRGSLSGSVAGNALTLSLSAEIVGPGCTLAATLGGIVTPGDPDNFRVGIDTPLVLPQVRFRPGVRALALSQLLPNARTVGEELAEALDRLFGTTGSRLSQDPATGVASATLSGRRFAFLQTGLAPRPVAAALERQQVTPSLATDGASGTVTVTTTSGAQVSLVPAPLDLEALLGLLAPLGVSGVDIAGSQYVFSTTGSLSLSVRFDLEVGSGGTTPGVVGQSDGTALTTYTTGDTQRANPLVVDQALFAQAALARPGATSVTQAFDGVVSLVTAGQTTRLRPDFSVAASPAGAKLGLVQEGASALVFDTGDGRRQRFFVIP